MYTSPGQVPMYRAITIVSTVLSRDESGELVHGLTVTTTLPEVVAVVYDLI